MTKPFSSKGPLENTLKEIFRSPMFNLCYDLTIGMNITFHHAGRTMDNPDTDENYSLDITFWEEGTDSQPIFTTFIRKEDVDNIRSILIKVYGGSTILTLDGREVLLIKSAVFKEANDYGLGYMDVEDEDGNFYMAEAISAQIDLEGGSDDNNYIFSVIGKATPPLSLVG